MVVPFLWMLSISIRDTSNLSIVVLRPLPSHITFENYRQTVVEGPFGRWLLNSFIVTTTVTVAVLFFDSMAGYGFAKKKFLGRDVIFIIMLLSLMVPFQVTIVPLFLMFKNLGLVNTYPGLILPQCAGVFGVFLMRQYMLPLPRDLIDAAKIDGAPEFKIYWQVILPLCKAPLSALAIFSFMGTWNEFLWSLIITSSEKMMPITVGLATFLGKYQTHWGSVMAGAVIALLPILIVFLVLQRQFVEGIALTGLKL